MRNTGESNHNSTIVCQKHKHTKNESLEETCSSFSDNLSHSRSPAIKLITSVRMIADFPHAHYKFTSNHVPIQIRESIYINTRVYVCCKSL